MNEILQMYFTVEFVSVIPRVESSTSPHGLCLSMINDLYRHSYPVCGDKEVSSRHFIVFALYASRSIIQRDTDEPSALQDNIAAIT